MSVIPAVSQQNLIPLSSFRRRAVIQRFRDLPAVIAETVNGSLQPVKFHAADLPVKKRIYIVMPPECPVIGIPADIIMIPRDQYHLRMRQCGKQVIRFFKFSQKRLPVKQISRNQKKICLLFLTDPDNTLKRIPDLLRPLFRI